MILSIFDKNFPQKLVCNLKKPVFPETSFYFGRFHLVRILLPHMYDDNPHHIKWIKLNSLKVVITHNTSSNNNYHSRTKQ